MRNMTEEDITVSFVNNSDTQWEYGEAFEVEALLDDVWYELPVLPEAGWYDIASVVELGEEREHTYYVQARNGKRM